MGLNLNGTFDVLKLIAEKWSTIWGMLGAWIIEVIIVVYVNHHLNICSWLSASLFLAYMLPTTFLLWTIATRRWFQRSTYNVFLPYAAITAVCAVFYIYLYPNLIEHTKVNLPYMNIWGTALLAVLLGIITYICYFCYGKRDDLWIVFLVSNRSSHEKDIKKALDEARIQIEQIAPQIHIVIPPFGIANGIGQSERYINGHFNQADAVIFASMTDSSEGYEFGYKFTRFTSRMSRRYIEPPKDDDFDVDRVLTESQRGREWNTLNISKDDISRTLEVAGNLKELFMMYVSCIYLYKHRYTEAIAIAEQLYTYKATGIVPFDDVVKDLVANAYVTAARAEEENNRDFGRAKALLDECIRKLPHVKYSLVYKLALARLYFYDNNMRESKRVTKSVRASFPWAEWYWTINLAFYARCERKPKEVYTHYKHLIKAPKPTQEEVEFSIRFQEKELKYTIDDQYRLFLYHGLAFLNLYLDEKKSNHYLNMVEGNQNIEGYDGLAKMRELILSSKGKLKMQK